MLHLWMSVVVLLLLPGCASVLHGDVQQMQVTVVCKDRVVPAACEAQNAKGIWRFQAPAALVVNKDLSSLQIACRALYFPEITATVPSRLNLSMAGNLLVGGLIGTGLDLYQGAAFTYSHDVRIAYPACQ